MVSKTRILIRVPRETATSAHRGCSSRTLSGFRGICIGSEEFDSQLNQAKNLATAWESSEKEDQPSEDMQPHENKLINDEQTGCI
jgi:hypothetical protein